MTDEKRMIDVNGDFVLKDTNGYTLDFGYGFIQIYDGDGNLRCQFDIDDIPTVDAVPVRCKNCQYYQKAGGVFDYDYCTLLYYCDGTHREVCEEDFCSYGEEKSNGI